MRIAGRLASEVLDYLTPHIKPGITTREIDRLAAEYMKKQGTHLRHAGLPAAGLSALPGLAVHLGQPRGVPRHPERQAAQEGRHRQRRRHRHQGRLVRRHQPHVHRRRGLHRGQAAGAASPTTRCGTASSRSSRACAWATSAAPSRSSPRSNGFSVVREFCGHGIGRNFHEEPQVLHYGKPGTLEELQARHDLHHRADDQRRPPRR